MTCVTEAGEFFLVCVSSLAGLGNRSASSGDSTSVIIGMDNFLGNSGVLADTPVNQHTISVKRCGCNLLLLCIIMYWVGIITHFSDILALLIITSQERLVLCDWDRMLESPCVDGYTQSVDPLLQ